MEKLQPVVVLTNEPPPFTHGNEQGFPFLSEEKFSFQRDETDYNFLSVTAKEAENAVLLQDGGPFGVIIVKNRAIV